MDSSLFVQHTAQSFQEAARRLRACAVRLPESKAELEELEIVHGVHYHPDCLVFADDLGITPLHVMNDWNHTYLETGLFDRELGVLMFELKERRAPTTYSDIGSYISLWTWPQQVGRHGTSFMKLFDRASASKYLTSKHFSAGASEQLSLMPVLRLYFQRVALPQGFFQDGVRSMILLIDCVDVLQSTRSRHSLVTPEDVRAAVLRHLEAKLQAYGDEWFQYKDHVALHLWEQYAQAGRLSPCFVQERYHKETKANASLRRNTTGYERGLVEELTVSQMISNERASFCREGLVNPTPADAAVLKAIVGFGLAARGDEVSVSRTYETTSMCKISVHDVAVRRPLG